MTQFPGRPGSGVPVAGPGPSFHPVPPEPSDPGAGLLPPAPAPHRALDDKMNSLHLQSLSSDTLLYGLE